MRSKIPLFVTCLLALVILLYGMAVGQVPNTPQHHPGIEAYTPTKIQWLAVMVSLVVQHRTTVDQPYSLDIVQTDDETLTIYVRYHPSVNRETMNHDIQTAREVIMIVAKKYGWESWVKIQENVEMYPSSKTETAPEKKGHSSKSTR